MLPDANARRGCVFFADLLSRGDHYKHGSSQAVQPQLPGWRLHVIMQNAQDTLLGEHNRRRNDNDADTVFLQ